MARKLTIELVPSTSWCSNVRSSVSPADWDMLRKMTYQHASYTCEICGGKGEQWPVECHEVWAYDDTTHIQTLKGLIALCPSCHQVKHYGLSGLRGLGIATRDHLKKVNGWTAAETNDYITTVWAVWRLRSMFEWTLILAWLATQGVELKYGVG